MTMTPGPFIAQPMHQGAEFWEVVTVDGAIVATGCTEADARAIAALPEVVEAAKEYRRAMVNFAEAVRYETKLPMPWEPEDRALPKLDAALAKMEGSDGHETRTESDA